MMRREQDHARALAVEPVPKGVGYVVLEGPTRLVDWGLAYTPRADSVRVLERLERLEALLERFQPTELVLEDPAAPGARRRPRAVRLLTAAAQCAANRGVGVRAIRWNHARDALILGGTKHEIALILSARYPELAPRVPPPRKPWMAEDARLSLFKALAMALAPPEPGKRRTA